MITITAVDLRDNISNILQKAASGEEILISYRGQTLTKIVPTKINNSNTKDILDFVSSLNFRSKNSTTNNMSAAAEKQYWRKESQKGSTKI